MLKESDIKKIIKNFNKYGKSLRPDGIYVFKNDKVYAAIKNSALGVPGVFCIEFKDDLIQNNAYYLLSKFDIINGTCLNKIMNGTGVKVSLDDNGIVTNIQNKDQEWDNPIIKKIKVEMMSIYFKHENLIDDNVEYTFTIDGELLDRLKEQKDFIISLSEYFDIPEDIYVLKISNKLLKNFSKDTKSIQIEISKKHTDIRAIRYSIIDDIAVTKCIYIALSN